MPKININKILSFSSEDPDYPVNNLLLNDPMKKWKCQNPGERTAIVVFQLDNPCVISSIDIGNENSAYIEVLVTRSETDDDFKVLLVMSSFMSPIEARQTININKVRMFNTNDLSKPENEQKWDRIKVVCTQPFNRHVKYGLSFINFYTLSGETNNVKDCKNTKNFIIRPESPINNISNGVLFARKKEQETLKGALAIREASTVASLMKKGLPDIKPQLKNSDKKPENRTINNNEKNSPCNSDDNSDDDSDEEKFSRNRQELLYNKDDDEPNKKIDKIIEKNKELKERKNDNQSNNRNNISNSKGESSKERLKESDETPKNKRKRTSNDENSDRKNKKPLKKEETPKKIIIKKPFNQLLNGVVFVISGIQNPERSNLRAMALSMGAKYKSDWDQTCTHLICAFVHTPKFQQVRGKGKIVKKSWIEDCHSLRKRLPWRRYALDKHDLKKDESEEEILEDIDVDNDEVSIDDIENQGYNDDQGDDENILPKQNNNISSFSEDTIDDIIQQMDTDDNYDHLPDYFDKKKFFIDPKYDDRMIKLFTRYIIAYKGTICNKSNDTVNYIITNDSNNYERKDICLKSDWIWECHNNQSLIPTDNYLS